MSGLVPGIPIHRVKRDDRDIAEADIDCRLAISFGPTKRRGVER